ncbi:MAG: adenosylcobalamin-dependent ribonucleoside-diphosphate reductase [Burkholderiales bacterium]|nr:adenosylcobalamin-dependent ribonucleoside-diphosphate reductase [Burkholderiales bacterium]
MQTVMDKITREPQAITVEVLAEKYCLDGESSQEDVFERVARAVSSVEKTQEQRRVWEDRFLQNMLSGAIGAGRIMASAGAANRSTWINCFVQPVADTGFGYDADGLPGIYQALAEAGETLRRGGGVGYNFSRIRPKGALVKGTNTDASGPCTFMDVFDASCQTVMAAGARRGAQMGILNIDHPDILEFIQAKRKKGRWNNFNVSVGVTRAFMDARRTGSEWHLVHRATPTKALIDNGAYQRTDGMWVYGSVKATDLWDAIMKSAYEFAEPGILFLDNINEDNNLRYTETIEATNPCGEIPIPPYGCCDLGPILLPAFVRDAFTPAAEFQMDRFKQAVRVQVRFLDNVLDGTPWPLDHQQKEAQQKRRIGVGFTGLGNALAMLGLRYDKDCGRKMAATIAEEMRDAAYDSSVELAIERGPFPLFNADEYLKDGTCASRLPETLKAKIRSHGIRNSHLLSIAPTGTVSLAFADNASNGIEPPFSLAYTRNKRTPEGAVKKIPVVDHGVRVFLETLEPGLAQATLDAICTSKQDVTFKGEERPLKGILPNAMVTALEMSCGDHLNMMGAVQPFICSAISKTVNVPVDYPFDDFKRLYDSAYDMGLKGCATYRPNDILGAVLETTAPAEKPTAVADVDPLRVSIERRPEGELDAVIEKIVYHTSEGTKSLYIAVSFANVDGVLNGKHVTIERPIEVFMPAGQSDEGQQWFTGAMRLMSLTARDGRLPKALADLRKVAWDKGQVRFGQYEKADGTRVPRFHSSEVAAIAFAIQQILYRRGFLGKEGEVNPVEVLAAKRQRPAPPPVAFAGGAAASAAALPGKKCQECGASAVIKKDGCDFCTNCGNLGSCG